jgi:protein TonB
MEISKILTADFLDLIFEGKNKEYGAYELRKTYSRRLTLSITVMSGIVLLLIAGYVFGNRQPAKMPEGIIPDDTKLANVELPKEEVKLPPPTVQKPPEVATIKNLVPRIVPDKEAQDPPPPVEDIENVKISNVTKAGTLEDGIVAPPNDGADKGIIVAPKRSENVDSLFLKVEIESTYPGGTPAWTRFLNKNLGTSYPQEAIENGIQGTVVIQFIVDREGNVSNVEAISGPEELRAPAIKVIQKSGKWIPAQQNTMKVKSYKRQPITFKLADE